MSVEGKCRSVRVFASLFLMYFKSKKSAFENREIIGNRTKASFRTGFIDSDVILGIDMYRTRQKMSRKWKFWNFQQKIVTNMVRIYNSFIRIAEYKSECMPNLTPGKVSNLIYPEDSMCGRLQMLFVTRAMCKVNQRKCCGFIPVVGIGIEY